MDLSRLSDFNLVAVHGGFGKAARTSGRSKASLSRRVAELETALGFRLIERDTHAFRLTSEGSALFERTDPLVSEILEISTEIAGNAAIPRGSLRVSAPVLFSHRYMGRIAAGLAAVYPEIRLELTTEDRRVDLVEEGYDAVIRINPEPGDLVGRRFLTDRMVIVAHPSIPKPSPIDGASVPAVVLDGARDLAWTARVDSRSIVMHPRPTCKLPSFILICDAVRAAGGVAALPLSLVRDDLAQGELSFWGDMEGDPVEVWVLHTSRRLSNIKVRAFVDFITKAFE